MRRKTTIVTEEFDDKGNVVNRITETTEEEDSDYIHPQIYPYIPTYPSMIGYRPEWVYRPGEVTCTCNK